MVPRVLIAEDDDNIRALIEMAFDEYETIVAADGAQAITMLAEARFDVAVLDVMMPEVDGFDVLTAIRGHSRHAKVPVVMVTAKTSESDHIEGFQRGADAYVTKPFMPGELVATVEELLSMSWEARSRQRDSEKDRAEFLRRLERRF